MAGDELTKPLLTSDPSQVIITVGDEEFCDVGSASDAIAESPSSQLHNQPYNHVNGSRFDSENPYESIGAGDFALPPTSTIDPFRNHTPSVDGIYEWLKIIIILPFVLIRLLLFGLCLLIGFAATKIALQGWKDKLNPMPKWRCRIMWVTRICTRCILFSFGYHWIRRKGRPAPREIAPIVVSNHISYIEPIFFFYELFPTIVSSDSHDSIPVVGTIIRAMQVIYVNRFSPASRKNAVNEIKRKASVNRFPRVLLFPEGTTTNGRLLMSFKLGAFLPGYPVQPVVIRYPHVHFDQSWGNISLAKLMFRMFTQFHNFMEVEYLPVIFPLEKEKESVTCFANRTGRAIASALNVAQTNYSYVDFMLLGKASEFKQENPSLYLIGMERQEIISHISSVEAVDFLDTFLSMNPDESGLVQINNFLKAFRLRACMLSEKIFGFLDMERRGSISFKHFLFGSVNVLKQPLFKEACELAFAKSAGNHFMSELQFGESIKLAIPDLNVDEIHSLFCLFDTNKEGKIGREEFIGFLRRNPLLIALFVPLLKRMI